MSKEARKSIADLLSVMAALRTPGSGCPWDLEQSFATIAPYTIEEAYEVADAIAKGDMGALEEELGDLLLQVVYHARMAEEGGDFAFADVVDGITEKMIRRHPHVFGSQAERAAGASPGFWERIKAEERSEKERRGVPSLIVGRGGGDGRTITVVAPPTPNPSPQGGGEYGLRQGHSVPSPLVGEGQGGGDGRTLNVGIPPTPSPSPQGGGGSSGILDEVPVALPALTRAVKLQSKAAKVGFDWPSLAPVFDKLKEELAELEQAIAGGVGGESAGIAQRAKIAEEFGDLLFVVANVARHLSIDPEASLRAANQKFIRRFRRIEELLAALGRTPPQSTLAEMDRLWDQAKAEERDLPSPD